MALTTAAQEEAAVVTKAVGRAIEAIMTIVVAVVAVVQ